MKIDQSYVDDLLNKLKAIDGKIYSNQKDKDGDIGERFVKDCIKYYMWEKDFRLYKSGNRTFTIEGHYKADKSGYGGIDFRFKFVHNKKSYDCYIESKNWDKYKQISPNTFKSEILDRFMKYANNPNCIRVVTMNKDNIPLIRSRCLNNNIHILPIDTKIETSQLNPTSLRKLMENFLDGFDNFMREVTGVRLRYSWKLRKRYPRPIDADIVKGLQPRLIASKHCVSEEYVYKGKSELRKKDKQIIDGRSKEAVMARLLTKDDLAEMGIYID